jgi:hypothetical protein
MFITSIVKERHCQIKTNFKDLDLTSAERLLKYCNQISKNIIISIFHLIFDVADTKIKLINYKHHLVILYR